MNFRRVLRVAAAVMVRPRLWATALRQVHRLAPRGWSAFRKVTQYGHAAHPPEVDDVLVWLEWCRALPAALGAGSSDGDSGGDH